MQLAYNGGVPSSRLHRTLVESRDVIISFFPHIFPQIMSATRLWESQQKLLDWASLVLSEK